MRPDETQPQAKPVSPAASCDLRQAGKFQEMSLAASQLLNFNKSGSNLDTQEIKHILQCLQELCNTPCTQGDLFHALQDLQQYLKQKALFFYDATDRIISICLQEAIPILIFDAPTFSVQQSSTAFTKSLLESFKECFSEEMKPDGILYEKLKRIKNCTLN
jgi:hypothetical protein